jgi:cholesterol 7alpha-monooxygenase
MDRLLHCFGLSSESRQLAWNKPLPGGPNDAIMKVMNPQYKSLVHHIEDIYKLQLLPGERLDVILDTVLSQLDAALTWPRLSGPYVLSSTTDCRRVSIKTLCSFLVTNATTRSLFTDLIFEYEPKLIDHMAVFNDYSWACVFNVPRAFTPKLNKAKDTLSQAVRQFVRSTREKRSGASWSINAIIDAMQCFGMDEDSQVAMLFMIWWA